MMKKVILSTLLVVILAFVPFMASGCTTRFLSSSSVNNADKILIMRGETGEKYYLTDKQDIESFITTINSVELHKKGKNNLIGCAFLIKVYENDKVLDEFYILSSNSFVRKDVIYEVKNDSFNIEVIENFCK